MPPPEAYSELIFNSLFCCFCIITPLLSPGCGKYCFFALLNSDSEIAAPDSGLSTAFTKSL